ncbi:MAG: peptidoglycan-binding domain-containing protein [Saprospiraceae bacterium]|nr:peptidoglycan-binding protein [Saprospiraceae bacterium]MDW8230141.1 peptidoglycan-binding domain-containing protein [Saprospiraceae bacterium]
MVKWLFLAFSLLLSSTLSAQHFHPPQAQPGRCYVQCLVPDRYEWVSENIILRPEREELAALPPLLAERRDSYVVRPAHVRLRAIAPQWAEEEVRILLSPAGRKAKPEAYVAVQETLWLQPPVRVFAVSEPVWESVQEAVEIEPAHQKVEVLPIRYRWVPQEVEVRPPGRRWIRKKPAGGCLEADPENCAIWCLVETPARMETVYRQEPIGCDSEDPDDCIRYTIVPAKTTLKPAERLKEPARAVEQTEPGHFQIITRWQLRPGQKEPTAPANTSDEYLTLRRKVLRREARVETDSIPAVYAPIQRKVLLRDGGVETRVSPPEYITVMKQRLITRGGYWTWREVLCEEKLANLNIRQLQEALKARGYYAGRVDGVLNEQVKAAILRFQAENDLPADGNVDIETLQALGLGG